MSNFKSADYQAIARACDRLELDVETMHGLADTVGAKHVRAALEEAVKVGKSLRAPEAFVRKRAGYLSALETRQREHDLSRSAWLDQAENARKAEREASKRQLAAETPAVTAHPPEGRGPCREPALHFRAGAWVSVGWARLSRRPPFLDPARSLAVHSGYSAIFGWSVAELDDIAVVVRVVNVVNVVK